MSTFTAAMMSMVEPEVMSESTTNNWLDVVCPRCDVRNRIGVNTARDDGNPCRYCGALLDFWAAWNRIGFEEDQEDRRREFWADAF